VTEYQPISTEKPQNAITQDPANTTSLPDPKQWPNADTVIFDGKCRFCIGQVQRLNRWDGKHRLAFLSLHDPRVAQLCPDLSFDELMEQMFLITPTGNRFGGAAVIRYLSRKLPKLWWAAPLLHVPFSLPLWQWCYSKIAARRYQVSGMQDDCTEGTCDIDFGSKPNDRR
jgi:predicted DCC family thiol-disulfide oxidoreductase YuxK